MTDLPRLLRAVRCQTDPNGLIREVLSRPHSAYLLAL